MKLRKKLVLSALALAACAITMVSTTFAWYTSNTTVTAGNLNGTSAASGAELLLISENASKWSTAIASATPTTSAELKPLEYKNNTLDDMSVEHSGTDASGYVEYTFYLKNASTKPGNLHMSIASLKNTTGVTESQLTPQLPAKSIIGANHSHLGITSESTTSYTVDMLRVLCMDVEVTPYTYSEEDSSYSYGSVTEKVYDLETKATRAADDLGTSFNAHDYYNAVMTQSIANTDSTVFDSYTGTGTIDLGALPTAGTVDTNQQHLKVVIKLFINGWDLACFDACQGQTFSLGLEFSVV